MKWDHDFPASAYGAYYFSQRLGQWYFRSHRFGWVRQQPTSIHYTPDEAPKCPKYKKLSAELMKPLSQWATFSLARSARTATET